VKCKLFIKTVKIS